MDRIIAGPTQPSERIVTLDIVRGFALLGILVMNLPGMSTSWYAGADGSEIWPAWWDVAAERVRDVLFDGKFNSMFSFLFAVGFTIQLGRLNERAGAFGSWIYARRLLILFGFGVVHSCLVWPGDVLHIYALLGLLLLVARPWSDRVVIALIAAGLIAPGVISLIRLYTATPEFIAQMIELGRVHEASNNAAFGSGSWLQSVAENTKQTIFNYTAPTWWFALGFYVSIFTTMLLGLLAGRRRWIQNAQQYRAVLPRLQWSALALGIVCGVVYAIGAVVTKPFEITPLKILFSSCYALARVSLMGFYVITIVRLALHVRWRQRLSAFAVTGRMPLTNYLLQSLIGTTLFYAWGFGLWGKLGWLAQLVLAFAIFFLIQVPLSRWWMRRFAFGPMEYLWRTLTYGRLPMIAPAAQPA